MNKYTIFYHKMNKINEKNNNYKKKIMPEYSISCTNIHIIDSYAVSKKMFKTVLSTIKEDNPTNPVVLNRSMFSMKMEWATHNFLYMVNYERERTCDVDINWPMKFLQRMAYCLCGMFSWLFID